MGNLQFSMNVPIEPERLMKFITDFKTYSDYFPAQIKSVKIIDEQNNEIITEERIIFSTLIKNEIVQKSQHKLISNKELCTKIIDGPAKNTIINIICIENGQGSEIKFDINLKLSLKAKFLSPLIKKLYKRYLTAIIYKISGNEQNLLKMTSENMVNWDNVFKYSKTFQENSPIKWIFVEDFFTKNFYEELYQTYPKKDDSWIFVSSEDKSAYRKNWGKRKPGEVSVYEDDTRYSESWNKFYRYIFSDEFLSNMKKFSNVPINKVKTFSFMLITKNGYQQPHTHNAGPSTLILMLYFNKNWKKGDPGGTYISPEEDESKIIFEPYNLNNSAMIFHDGPKAGHGVRYVSKDVERRAIQIYLEEYSPETGWNVYPKNTELKEI